MKRTLSIVLFVLLLCAVGRADVTSVSNTVTLVTTEGLEGYLHAPRYQIACGTSAGRIMIRTVDGTNRYMFSSDSGATWSDGGFSPTSGSDHDHIQYANDTAYSVSRNSNDSTMVYQIVDIANGSLVLDSTIGFQVNCGYNGAIGTMIPFGDLIIGGSRGYACSFEGLITTKDHSNTTYTQIADYSTYTTSTRFGGGHAWGDSTVWIGGFIDNGSGTNDSVIVWIFNPGDSTWTETNPFSGVDIDRFFSVNTFHDTVMMVAAWLDNSSKLVTAWRGIGTANTWTYDTVISTTAQDRPNAALTHIESTDRMVMWTHYDGDLRIHAFNDDFTWSPAFDVIIDSVCEVVDLAIPEYIPSSHGSVAYAGVKVGGNTLMATAELTEEGNWIMSLPYTISTRGNYYLGTDLDWPGGPYGGQAILINADSVDLDLNGYTLTFGSADSGGISAIYLDNVDTAIIHNGTIQHTPTDSASGVNPLRAITLEGCTYITIRDITASVTGKVVQNSLWWDTPYTATDDIHIYHSGGIHTIYIYRPWTSHIRIANSTLTNAVVGFYDRQYRPACVVSSNYINTTNITDPDVDYTVRLDSNTFYYTQTGALLGYNDAGGAGNGSEGVFHVYNNRFVGRIRNEGPYTGYRNGNSFATDYYHTELIRSYGNHMTYDSSGDYRGGAGMFLVNAGGYDDDNDTNYFQYDTIYSALVEGSGLASGIKIRNRNRPTIFENCVIEAHADTFSTDSTRGNQAQAIEIGHSYTVAGADNPYIVFKNCEINALDKSGGSDLTTFYYRVWPSGQGYDYRYYTVGNYVTSDGYFFQFGETGGTTEMADSMRSYSDTFAMGPEHGGQVFAGMISNTCEAQWNFIQDPTYIGGAAFDFNTGTASTQDLTEKVEMVLTVKDDGGNIIEGANVWCVSSIVGTDTIFKKTTNASGQVTDTVNTNFISRTATDTTLAQYNDFTVGAAFAGDTGEVTFTLTMDINDTLIQLGDIPISQTNVVVDTNNLSAYIQTTFTAIDSGIRWYKLLWGTSDPPTAKYGDSIESPTNPDTFVVMPTIPNTKYYFMTVVQDSATLDTSALDSITTLKTRSHSLTEFDVNDVSFRVEDDYVANTVDSIWMVWDDDNDMADSLGRFVITAGITDPDTLVASGLNQATKYYFRVRLSDQLGISSSALDSATTISPGVDRPVVLNSNITISGKVIIQ